MKIDNKGIVAIGSSGLVGSRIYDILRDRYSFLQVSKSTGVDITRQETLGSITEDREHDYVLHLAAKTDVDGCEKDKENGEEGEAWKINVLGTKNVVDACKKSGKQIIYISTDFVFDGETTPEDGYTEEDIPNPPNWYARTKYEGEKIVKEAGIPYLILRIAYPFRAVYAQKKDFIRAILSRLKENKPVTAITDHVMTPTYIDDIAEALDVLLNKNATGIYHVVGSECISPFDACQLLAREFSLDTSLIEKTTREIFFKDRAPRAFNLSINNDKIENLGVNMRTFTEALGDMKQQI